MNHARQTPRCRARAAGRRRMTRPRARGQEESLSDQRFFREQPQKVADSRKAGSDQDPIPPSPESGLYSVRPGSMGHTCSSRAATDEFAGSLGSGPHHRRCQVWSRRRPPPPRARRPLPSASSPHRQRSDPHHSGTRGAGDSGRADWDHGAAWLAVILDVPRAGLPWAASDLLRAPAAAAPCPPARCPRGDSAPIGESRPWQVRKSLQSCTESQPFP